MPLESLMNRAFQGQNAGTSPFFTQNGTVFPNGSDFMCFFKGLPVRGSHWGEAVSLGFSRFPVLRDVGPDGCDLTQVPVEIAQHGFGNGDRVVLQVRMEAGLNQFFQPVVCQFVFGKAGFQACPVFEFGDGVGHGAGVVESGGAGQFAQASIGVFFGIDPHEVVNGESAGFAVGDAEVVGQWIGTGMGGGGAGQGEGQSGCDGRFGHFFPGQRVFRFFAGGFQMAEDEPGGVDGEGVADRLMMYVPVGFDGVAEYVHAGTGGHVFRDGVGQFGIDDGDDGIEGRGV